MYQKTSPVSLLGFYFSHGADGSEGFPEYKLGVGKRIYHYLVSIYSALFRSTTPLYTDWEVETNWKLLDNDQELVRSFLDLRTEVFWYRKLSRVFSIGGQH